MYRIIAAIVLLLVLQFGPAQAQPQSLYLADPEKNIDYIIDEAEFWSAYKDTLYGGFFNLIDQNGVVTDQNIKSFNGQSRMAYAFTRAFMVTGEERYLQNAHHAIDFVYTHAWDEENDGWFFSSDRQGNITPHNPWWDPNEWKWSFQQHYALVGILPLCKAGNRSCDKAWLKRGFNALNEHLWDDRKDLQGYFAEADLDWSHPRGKGFTPTVDAVTTHALGLYLLNREKVFKDRLLALADNMVEHLVASMDNANVSFGIAESYDRDWNLNDGNTGGSVGHVLKTSWCLGRAYLVEPLPQYRKAAQRLMIQVWQEGGYDHNNGAPFRDYDWSTGKINRGKDYWMVEQAVMCGLINYYIAESDSIRDIALEMADESISFYMQHFWDQEKGGSFSQTDNSGTVINGTKGDVWKSGYHAVELAFYTYLYGNLYLHAKPVTLHYLFAPADSQQMVSLYPLAIEDNRLKIKKVTLDDKPFTDFNRDKRTLMLAEGEGGHFSVTFEPTFTAFVENQGSRSIQTFQLEQNYPNPFNSSTIILYTVAQSGHVMLTLYDLLGRRVQTLVDEYKTAGSYSIQWNRTNHDLASGTYFYRLECNGYTDIKRMLLLK